jgi:hypothetical protein
VADKGHGKAKVDAQLAVAVRKFHGVKGTFTCAVQVNLCDVFHLYVHIIYIYIYIVCVVAVRCTQSHMRAYIFMYVGE